MPESKDARRLIPDPENEPDFYATSSKYPLPDDPDFDMASPLEEVEQSTKSKAVTSPRLASTASWFKEQMPPAKRLALMSNIDALKGVETVPAPRVNTTAARAAAAPSPFGSPVVSPVEELVNSTSGASWLKDKMPPVMAPPRSTYLDEIMDRIAAATAPSSPTFKASIPVASVAPAALREHSGAPGLITDVLSRIQEVNHRNNHLMAVAALNANLGGLDGLQQQAQQQVQQAQHQRVQHQQAQQRAHQHQHVQRQQAQNPACSLQHLIASLQQSQSQPQPLAPPIHQGSGMQTHSELLAALLRSTAPAPSYGS
jgi:hypothetical protein